MAYQIPDDTIKVVPSTYKLDSDNTDVLRLEICKSQPTRDDIISCLTQQQEYLSKESIGIGIHVFISLAIAAIVLIAIFYFSKYFLD